MTADFDEFTEKVLRNTARLSAQLAVRMTLAVKAGVSPNQLEVWVNKTMLSPQVEAITKELSKIVLDTVIAEITQEV
jgi:hypothetical protein